MCLFDSRYGDLPSVAVTRSARHSGKQAITGVTGMADGTADVARAFAQLTTALIDMMTRLSVALIERRAERLREAARQSEQSARQERARLARHHAADSATWQRTTDPAWWARATPEQIAKAWRAASTWHQIDPDAAGARQAIAERLRGRGVEVIQDVSAKPEDARWLRTALDLALAEREERIAFRDDLDTGAELAGELMWASDETPRAGDPAAPAESGARMAAQKANASQPVAEVAQEVLWPDDEQPASRIDPANGVDLSMALFDAAQARASAAAAAEPAGASRVTASAQQTAVAAQPDEPQRLPPQELARMAGMLQAAWQHEPQRAQQVLADGAWPALARSMHRLDSQGKDVPGLLSRLDSDMTKSSIPAITTDWALRAAAAGPLTARRMRAGREFHQARLAATRDEQPADQVTDPSQDQTTRRQPVGEDTQAARLLAAAFPQSTRAALHTQRSGVAAGRSGRDRSVRGERNDRQAER